MIGSLVAYRLRNGIIGTGAAIRTAIIYFFISNEGVSLLENAAAIGLPVPGKLKDVLVQLHGDRDADVGDAREGGDDA